MRKTHNCKLTSKNTSEGKREAQEPRCHSSSGRGQLRKHRTPKRLYSNHQAHRPNVASEVHACVCTETRAWLSSVTTRRAKVTTYIPINIVFLCLKKKLQHRKGNCPRRKETTSLSRTMANSYLPELWAGD